MSTWLPELIIGPLLVGGSTLVCRRWGAERAGVLSAFPAVVGPVLLIVAQERGAVFGARAANGTLLGLVALSGFVVGYAWAAQRAPWGLSLAAGWACSALLAVLVGSSVGDYGFPAGLAVACVSLVAAHLVMPRCARAPLAGELESTDDLAMRMALTAMLVLVLAGAARLVGPLVGGMLAALPALASVLAVSTHRRQGPRAVIAMLRGMVVGMAGFVAFCAAVAVLIVPLGTAAAFAAADVAAVSIQGLVSAPQLLRRLTAQPGERSLV